MKFEFRFDLTVFSLFSFQPCIKRSFKAEVYSCPACRADLDKKSSLPINQSLTAALNHFYPGYEAGRE